MRLNIHPASWDCCLFITLDSIKGTYGKEDLARPALWVYAVYKAHNFLRYRPLDEDVQPLDVLAHYAVEGTLGHPFAMIFLDGAFRTGTASILDTSSFDHLDISD